MNISELFTCPQCGKHTIQEVQSYVTLISVLRTIGKDDTTYAKSEASDGEFVRYQCGDCGESLTSNFGITSSQELFTYLVRSVVDQWDTLKCQKFLDNELGIDCNILDYLPLDDVLEWRAEIRRRMEEIEEGTA